MITPCDCAGDCAGGITAETVFDEPLAVEQEFTRHLRIVPRHCSRNRSANLASFVHESGHTPNEFLTTLSRFAPRSCLGNEFHCDRGFAGQRPIVLRCDWSCSRSAGTLGMARPKSS